MYFGDCRLSKTSLDHSLKSIVSEHPSTVNLLKCLKHFWNLHENTFIIFFNHSEEKWFGKYLPYWNLKSQGSLLTHWLPMTSILFGIERISSSLFECNYFKNEKLFLNFLFHLWNLHQILSISKEKWWS